jgi:hypothetical protein
LESRHSSLRTVAVYTETSNIYGRERVTGSRYVILATTDLAALRKAVAEKAKDPKQPKPKREMDVYEKRAKPREKAKRERAKQVRALLSNAAPAFAPVIPVVLQELLYKELRYDFAHSYGEAEKLWKKANQEERGAIIAGALLKKHVGLSSYEVPAVDKAAGRIVQLARAAGDWRIVFDRLDNIPITNYFPRLADLPDRPRSACFMLDLRRITVVERILLVSVLAKRFKLPPREVELDLEEYGCPILAADVLLLIPAHFASVHP